MAKLELENILARISSELDDCVAFWTKFSHDEEEGGFYNCLSSQGEVYDTTKYCWLQGRQVWMYCTLYQQVERFRLDTLYQAAVRGGAFLINKVKMEDTGKCYFAVSREGRPVKIQRTIYTEVFYVMAMCGLHGMTGEEKYKREAEEMMERILHWTGPGASELGRPQLSGEAGGSSLAVPMCLVSLLTMMRELGWDKPGLEEDCVAEIMSHVVRDGKVVLENVGPQGQELPGVAGRMVNPGHVIECGWFLLELAKRFVVNSQTVLTEPFRNNDQSLAETSISTFIDRPLKLGWDQQHGGIFYFLDADGLSPTALEWDMKLWWVHMETLVASLMAYQHTNTDSHRDNFLKIFNYTFDKFPLAGGEMAGYLDREGRLKMDFKGGPYKGCFHVPRALMICEKIIKEILNKS